MIKSKTYKSSILSAHLFGIKDNSGNNTDRVMRYLLKLIILIIHNSLMLELN